MQSNYDGIPFTFGSIFGKRTWILQGKSRLLSPSQKVYWDSREITAQCDQKGGRYSEQMLMTDHLSDLLKNHLDILICECTYVRGDDRTPEGWRVLLTAPTWNRKSLESLDGIDRASIRPDGYSDRHKASVIVGNLFVARQDIDKTLLERHGVKTHMSSCSCGLYAYLANSRHCRDRADQTYPGEIAGVIEGFGETLVGTLGFRSQKARIKGLAFTGLNRIESSDKIQLKYTKGPTYRPARRPIYRVDRVAKALTRRYGVPVFDSERELYDAFPVTTREEVKSYDSKYRL